MIQQSCTILFVIPAKPVPDLIGERESRHKIVVDPCLRRDDILAVLS
ncbi:hypothetical protein ACFLT9_04570 [Acidobacteriota bacterium]